MFIQAIEQLESMDPGQAPRINPEMHWSGRYVIVNPPVYCNTFGKYIKQVQVEDGTIYTGNNIASGVLEEYVRRLHGRSVIEDLRLAGLWVDNDEWFSWYYPNPNTTWWGYENSAHGIGVNVKKEDDWIKADIIGYDGKIHKKALICNPKEHYPSFSGYDSSSYKPTKMPFLWFKWS